jgi:hypothetical protein
MMSPQFRRYISIVVYQTFTTFFLLLKGLQTQLASA